MATRKPQQFEFTFEGKTYVIKGEYQAEAATLVLDDGHILQVSSWLVGIPFEAEPDQVETFDPSKVQAAELAREKDGWLAELVPSKAN